MDEVKTDFCVVGGGPAGLTLALLLLRSGAEVTVVERSGSMERHYRGEILQPGGQAVLDALGVLDGIVARGAHRLSGFRLLANEKVLMDIDYRRLAEPHNSLLSVPQENVLAELLARCEKFEGFTYLGGRRIRELTADGIVAADGQDAVAVRAQCVIGADGRYSKTRQLAGIEAGRMDVFDQDVLWFKLSAPGRLTGRVHIHRASNGVVLVHDSYPDRLQVGWTLPHRGYQDLVAHGLDHVKARLREALPAYADLIDEQITSLRELTLLDVFGGCAAEWARERLVLIGDAAHTHGPLGAQGINLAVQDAALLHPILMKSLRENDFSADALGEFPRLRRPDVDVVLKTQQLQSKAMLSPKKAGEVIRPVVAALIRHTPLGPKITRRIAFGNPSIKVRSDLFT